MSIGGFDIFREITEVTEISKKTQVDEKFPVGYNLSYKMERYWT